MSRLCLRCDAAVLLHHLERIHTRQNDRDLLLIIQPAKPPLGRRPAATALFHSRESSFRKHIYKFASPKRLHDDDRYALGGSCAKTADARLGDLIQIVILDLTEVPVVVVQDFEEVFCVAVIRKSNVPDLTARFLLGNPVDDTDLLQLLPHGHICHVVHQIVVNIRCSEPGELLVKILIQLFPAPDHVLRKLCRDVDLLADVVPLKNLADGFLTARVNIGGIKIIDTRFVGGHNFFLRPGNIYTVSLFSKTHAAVTQYRQFIAVFVVSVLHNAAFLI